MSMCIAHSFVMAAIWLVIASNATAGDSFTFAWVGGVQGFSERMGNSVAVDADGNTYVAGYFEDSVDLDPGPGIATHTTTGSVDAFVLKLNSAGSYVWSKSFGGDSTTFAGSIYIDSLGIVYVAGGFSGTTDFDPGDGTDIHTTGTSSDAFLIQIGENGDYQWGRVFGGSDVDTCAAVTVDANGFVYVVGTTIDAVDFDPGPGDLTLGALGFNAFVSKFDASGTHVWAATFGGMGYRLNAMDVAVPSSGDIFIVGDFEGTQDFDPGAGDEEYTSSGYANMYTLCLNALGEFRWVGIIGGANYSYGDAFAVGDDGLYLTGAFYDTVDFDPGAAVVARTSAGETDAYILKLDLDGNYTWVNTYGATDHEHGGAIGLGEGGVVYAAGYCKSGTVFEPGGQPVLGPDTAAYVLGLTSSGVVSKVYVTAGTTATAYALATYHDSVVVVGEFQYGVDFNPEFAGGQLEGGNFDNVFILKLRNSVDAGAGSVLAVGLTSFLVAFLYISRGYHHTQKS